MSEALLKSLLPTLNSGLQIGKMLLDNPLLGLLPGGSKVQSAIDIIDSVFEVAEGVRAAIDEHNMLADETDEALLQQILAQKVAISNQLGREVDNA
jgi:hypothetical protein